MVLPETCAETQLHQALCHIVEKCVSQFQMRANRIISIFHFKVKVKVTLTSDFFIILFNTISTSSKELSVLLAIFHSGFYKNDVRSDVQSDDVLQHNPMDVATKISY